MKNRYQFLYPSQKFVLPFNYTLTEITFMLQNIFKALILNNLKLKSYYSKLTTFCCRIAFFFNAMLAIHLMQAYDNSHFYGEWKLHLSHLAVQIPMATTCNAVMVAVVNALYDIKAHPNYVFCCLMLESVCGIHLGKNLLL